MDSATVVLAQRVYTSALEWLGRVRTCFALRPDIAVDDVDLQEFKALGELAVAARMVQREAVAGPETASLADTLLEFVWQQLDSGELLHRMQLEGPGATHPMETYSTLAAAGYRHQELERLLTHLATLRATRTLELVPNRQLAVVAAARRIGLPPHADPTVLAQRTWLGGLPEPWMLDVYNAYSMTHTVFHLTDFGARPEQLPPQFQDYLHKWLPVWLEVFTETRLWDLLGELLIVGMCLSDPVHYPMAWEALVGAQREDGMLPNGVTRPPRDSAKAFRNHHHPTVVAVVAGTLIVSRAIGAAPRLADAPV